MAGKKLYRSKNNKMLAGVCGGIAEYFDADPTIVRLLWAVLTILTGVVPGLLIYVVAAFIVPEQ